MNVTRQWAHVTGCMSDTDGIVGNMGQHVRDNDHIVQQPTVHWHVWWVKRGRDVGTNGCIIGYGECHIEWYKLHKRINPALAGMGVNDKHIHNVNYQYS